MIQSRVISTDSHKPRLRIVTIIMVKITFRDLRTPKVDLSRYVNNISQTPEI